MKEIATDIFSFEDLITSDALYVDKTAFVAKLVMGKSRSFFLSRPRRFDLSSVAFQYGYLSIAEWKKVSLTQWKIRYDFPNKEIRDCWFKNVLTMKPNTYGLHINV